MADCAAVGAAETVSVCARESESKRECVHVCCLQKQPQRSQITGCAAVVAAETVFVCVCVCVCVCVLVSVLVCVCVAGSERKRKRESVCVLYAEAATALVDG